MPIRRELRKYYRSEWRAYRLSLIAIHGAKCMACGRAVERYLNLAHVTHDPRQNSLVSLWCPSCHSRHDTRQRVAMTRRTLARRHGQLWLSVELEFAPYPDGFWPRRAIGAPQLSLFE
jgi:5-methylcytosine-specific restriction endonuclease McrA